MDTDAEQLENQAYAAWELLEHAEAAKLFLAAAELESQQASLRSKWAKPDSSFLCRVRAAFCQWLDGQFDSARPTLIEATTFDWKNARLWADRRDTEKAFAYLLATLATDGEFERFGELWTKATDRMDELGFQFPSIIPMQKLLLVSCMNLNFSPGIQQIIDNLNPKLLAKNPELQMLKAQAISRLSDCG
ncbi:hypothetical protein [Crateriforma spongiae]|uniref:hypothetical protein n=1 Tax=Crateriforma spongiae TaxID=2724528 RepID=UPI001446B87B|nr:hypothetical protein [Crateriforma spongiae]